MHVNELDCDQIDYWVARARGIDIWYPPGQHHLVYVAAPTLPPTKWTPSRFWSQGGPIIEEMKIDLNWNTESDRQWIASMEPDILAVGKTLLEAAMRAYIHACFGAEVGDRAATTSEADDAGFDAAIN